MTYMAKNKTSITLDPELHTWVQRKIKERKFASVSHAIGYALQELRKREP
jgi:Arc/MetJ-type ribon-helix-helix transcriptional regulator